MTMLSTLSNRSDLGGRPADTSVLIELGRHNIVSQSLSLTWEPIQCGHLVLMIITQIQDCLSTVMDGTAHR